MATPRVRRLDENGDWTFGRGAQNYASTGESTAQRVSCNLKLILGEWFLDKSKGVPWFRTPEGTTVTPILGVMPANQGYAEARIKQTILATEGVAKITEFSLTFDRNTRKLTVSGRGETVDGDAFGIAYTSGW